MKDIVDAELLLRKRGLSPKLSHTLLSRSIFLAYLHDREILHAQFLQKRFGTPELVDLFNSHEQVQKLFEWAGVTFNGDLIPEELRSALDKRTDEMEGAIRIVGALLSGTRMKDGQGNFWRYHFDVLPVEMISSVYERISHAIDSVRARQRSTHYTPLNVVDLVLSQTLDHASGHEKVLDPACGSGVFLVEAFRRLVSRRVVGGAAHTRELVRSILNDQIFGIDINPEAVEIAAFSLYLTALELDPDSKPEPTEELRFEPLVGNTLFPNNAFDLEALYNGHAPFRNRQFDLVVGNPPWTRSKHSRSAYQYCKDKRRNYPLARKSIDQAFLWRVGDFLKDNGRIGLVLGSKPFFSTAKPALTAKQALFKRYVPRLLVNLSELRQLQLFPTATAPAMVMVAKHQGPSEGDLVTYASARFDRNFQRHGIIHVDAEDVKTLSATRVVSDFAVLKIATYGGPRDLALINRLRQFPSLNKIATSRKWGRGQGYQTAGGSDVPWNLVGKPWLPSGVMPRYRTDTDVLGPLPAMLMHRSRPPKKGERPIYSGPLVITTRSIGLQGFESTYSEGDVVYTELYFGVTVPWHDRTYARVINAIFNSSLATYFLLLTGGTWGIERDEVKPSDVKNIPIPELSEIDQLTLSRVLAIEEQLGSYQDSEVVASLRQRLDEAVFALYGLEPHETTLIRDAISISLNLRFRGPGSSAGQRPSPTQLEEYAFSFLGVTSQFTRTINRPLSVTITDPESENLIIAHFRTGDETRLSQPVMVRKEQNLKSTMAEIKRGMHAEIVPNVEIRRHLRIYTPGGLFVVKPAELRYWSRSAGLMDADLVLSEHLRSL
jgi:hypothetical protein